MATAAPATMRWIEDNVYDPRYGLWTRANIGEVQPWPIKPLGWDLLMGTAVLAGWRDNLVVRYRFGEDELDRERPQVMGVFGGYAYLGATVLRIQGERTPGFSADMVDQAYFGAHPDVPPYVHEEWHDNPHTTEALTRWLGWVMGDRDQRELEADRERSLRIRAERPDLRSLSDGELLERARSLTPVCRGMFEQHLNQAAAAAVGPGIIAGVCSALGEPAKATRLLAGLGGVDSAAPSFALWDLSRQVRESDALTALFDDGVAGLDGRLRASPSPEAVALVRAFDAFLAEHGSRGPNEWDIHAPSWELQPEIALAALDRIRLAPDSAAPSDEHQRLAAERQRLSAEVADALADDVEARDQLLAALAAAATFIPGRERAKTTIIRVVGEIRLAVWEIGRRHVAEGLFREPRDVCLLFLDEVEQLVGNGLPQCLELVDARRGHLEWLHGLEPPFIIAGPPPPVTTWPRRSDHGQVVAGVGDRLVGMTGCAGKARGRARIVLDPSDPDVLEPGDVLVAPMTDPAWTPLFLAAAAVVVDVGAPLSHAIIVSRELGIPCVVSITGASRRIPDGALVEVDGDAGTVTIVGAP